MDVKKPGEAHFPSFQSSPTEQMYHSNPCCVNRQKADFSSFHNQKALVHFLPSLEYPDGQSFSVPQGICDKIFAWKDPDFLVTGVITNELAKRKMKTAADYLLSSVVFNITLERLTEVITIFLKSFLSVYEVGHINWEMLFFYGIHLRMDQSQEPKRKKN